MTETIQWHALAPAQRDACVHEKVMGHARSSAPHTCPTRNGGTLTYNVTSWQTGGPGVPRYTTRLDAIKQLRLSMAERFPLLNLHCVAYTYNRCYAAFALEPPADNDEWSEGNGEYCMEEAICIAALRGCGYEVQS